MGNGIAKIGVCFTGAGDAYGNLNPALYLTDEGLGHSFCYVRPDPNPIQPTGSSKIHSDEPAAGSSVFRTISGASVSANTSTTPLSGGLDPYLSTSGPLFESSTSFAAVPLQAIPRSGPLLDDDRGFMSGPIERGFTSGPLDMAGPVLSGPIKRSRSQSIHSRVYPRRRTGSGSLIRGLRRVISKLGKTSVVAPVKAHQDNWVGSGPEKTIVNLSSEDSLKYDVESRNLQWAQGKAGEDSVHVVVSEEHGWVFVGIYDGFNGPDATDFLLSNLYPSLQKELKGLLWDDESSPTPANFSEQQQQPPNSLNGVIEINPKSEVKSKIKYRGAAKKCQENQKRWKCEWGRERLELERRLNESGSGSGHSNGLSESINHGKVLEAMSRGLRKTEETYFDIADKMLDESPELALMGSCVVAMLMKGEDVYVMNVGDSRAVLAQNKDTHKIDHDLERIIEESLFDFQVKPSLSAFQLTMDHGTCVEQEVARIRNEHPDDVAAVVNGRVKGSLRVTRAFGAGFLKQPKWNDNLLEMFRVDYVGSSAYINCEPFLHHHRLGPKDQFLILSSDGLYQYFTNEEAVSEVELFMSMSPEGDPAQHLVEEVIFRAAKKAGMDFHDLLEIPQGDRRKYHDDVSIIIISFKGRIWRSCV